MTGIAAQVWTCVLTWLLVKTDGKIRDVHVTCQFSEDCVLPCSFEPAGGEEIHWFRQDVLIYSHPQSGNQNAELFVGRTSVPSQELALGNASLLLQRCSLHDRGRYRCRVIEGEKWNDSIVVVKVEARIRSVTLEMTRLSGYEEVKCSTRDVYPAPHVSWSTDPPTPLDKLKYTTRKMADKQGLYSMESKLKRLGNRTSLTYICSLNSSSASQTWRAVLDNVTLTSKLYLTFTWAEINSAEGQDLTIPCRTPWDTQDFTLTWSFTRAESSTLICTYNSKTQLISNQWNGIAWLKPQSMQKGDGSLRLIGLRSLEHAGIYTCSVSAFQRRHVGQTSVNISSVASENKSLRVKSSTHWWIPAFVVALLAIIAAGIVGILKLRDDCSKSKNPGKARYTREVKVTVNESEEIPEGSRLTADQTEEHT